MSFKISFAAVAIALLSACSIFAQKADKEKLGYYNYIQPPASDELLNKEYFLLAVELEDDDAYRRQVASQNFLIEPYKQASSDNPQHFTVQITEGTFTYSPPKKNSYENKGATVYYYKGDVRYHYTIKVLDENGEEIFRKDATGTESMQGEPSQSLSIANDSYMKNKLQFKQEIMLAQLKALAGMFNDQFSSVEKTLHLNAIKIKEKKYDYPEFNKAFDDLNRAYEILKTSPEPTEESEQLLDGIITTYSEFVKDVTPEDKKSMKNADVTAAAYYNLGIAQFLDTQYGDAQKSFSAAASYDDKVMYDVDYLIKTTTDLDQRTGLQVYKP